jgi:GalNAc-alpha-(1->4)-GalNAc-alpha-(1->3)-diNAcBac-PP-undecaprenol alpha-1,4-N-acetyl-D-galactosaminyltransferase
MRLTLVTNAFGCGGSERVVALWCQGFTDRGYQVTVLNMAQPENMGFFPLPEQVKVISLDLMQTSKNALQGSVMTVKRLVKMRQTILRTTPDRVITLYPQLNVLTIAALTGTGIPVYVTEHNDPKLCANGEIWETLRPWVYPRAARVVSVSQGVDRSFSDIPAHKRTVIYNPVVPQIPKKALPEMPGANPDRHWIVSMGRLCPQKGYDLLIPAFAQIADRYPEWQLVILGEGTDRADLEKLRDDLGMHDRIILPGLIQNVPAVLKKAELFVMSSRFEGFPMAHCEAMSSGLPMVVTDCDSGPREMVRHNLDGLLVEPNSIEALATGMDRLLGDRSLRQQFATRAPEILDRFGMERVMADWERLLNPDAVGSRSSAGSNSHREKELVRR